MNSIKHPSGSMWTRDEFVAYLTETLIPDLRESGRDATADDFEFAVAFMQDQDLFGEGDRYQERTLDLLAMPVVGNAHADADVWRAANCVAADESAPMIDRLAALRKMNELTGESDPCTPEALEDYLATFRD